MVKYEIIIYWSREDEAFIAEVPELPGCAADGETYQQALESVQVIIRDRGPVGCHGSRPLGNSAERSQSRRDGSSSPE